MNNIASCVEDLRTEINVIETKIKELTKEKEKVYLAIKSLEAIEGDKVDIEIRSANGGSDFEFYASLSGINPHRNVRNNGKIYRYDKVGRFINFYENSKRAKEVIDAEGEQKNPTDSKYIEYASKGSVNHKIKNSNHHYHKGSLWFDKLLTEEEIKGLREIKVFK